MRSFWDLMRPHATGSGSYDNIMTDVEEDRVKATYGREKYASLARTKQAWDPDNVFRLNGRKGGLCLTSTALVQRFQNSNHIRRTELQHLPGQGAKPRA